MLKKKCVCVFTNSMGALQSLKYNFGPFIQYIADLYIKWFLNLYSLHKYAFQICVFRYFLHIYACIYIAIYILNTHTYTHTYLKVIYIYKTLKKSWKHGFCSKFPRLCDGFAPYIFYFFSRKLSFFLLLALSLIFLPTEWLLLSSSF